MLEICRNLFTDLNLNHINYCHWKSNEHLYDGLIGETDLDVLADSKQYFQIVQILTKNNFKRYETHSPFKYSFIEDYLGFDDNTGKMIHIHLHFKLILGKKFVKEIHFPIEKYIFENTLLNHGVKVIDPNLEMILLFIRQSLKLRNKYLKKKYYSKHFMQEYNWLFKEIDESKVRSFATDMFDSEFANYIVACIYNIDDPSLLKRFNAELYLRFNRFYRFNRSRVFILHLFNKLSVIIRNILSKKLKATIIYKRTIPNHGVVIAFMGVDGAGKSTILSSTKKWLSSKLDVYEIYFGSGQGFLNILSIPKRVLKSTLKRERSKNRNVSKNNKANNSRKAGKIYIFLRTIWAMLIASDKKRKYKTLYRAKSKGKIVLCDRYPQTQITGFNDGPLLSEWLGSDLKIMQKIAKWEYNIYEMSKKYQPDVVIKLVVSKEVALNRKPETPEIMVEKKIQAIERISFDNDIVDTYVVNTEEDFEETFTKIRKIIKEYL